MTPQNDRKIWFTTRDLRYLYPSDNWKCPKSTILSFLGSCNYELQDFPYLVNHRSYKVGWPLKMTARFDLLRVVSDIYTPQANGSVPKIQFFAVWRICKEEIPWFSNLVNCRSHNDSVRSFVFLFTHFLTFICFLSIATCFDYLVTVCKLFLPISTYLLIVPARFYLFASGLYSTLACESFSSFLLIYSWLHQFC